MIRPNTFYIALLLLITLAGLPCSGQNADRKHLLQELIEVNDRYIPEALKRQSLLKGEDYYGAVFDADSVVSPIGTSQLVQALMCGYVSRTSMYYRSKEILERMTLAAQALTELQHEDGTIDLLTTNFHSTPDLGFTIFPLGISYSIMLQNKGLDYGRFASLLEHYLRQAGRALSTGGVHTPNHRWVICAALAWVNSFFPDPAYRERIEAWLAEKIDIDGDGQYHERSTAVYTPVSNRSLIDVARKMDMPYLYDFIRKNLDLTFYLVHANGELVTETSNRQDKYLRRNLAGYYLPYNHLALLDRDGRYPGMVDYILRTVPVEHLHYMLPIFLEDASLTQVLPPPLAIPDTYHRHFKHSDLLRIRNGKIDMSVITSNPTFFTFFKGNAALEAVRLSSAFFGKGQFQGTELKKEGETYVLSSTVEAPYYQPLPESRIPAGTDAWRAVPRQERAQSEVQTLVVDVRITPMESKAIIKISVAGPKNLPVTLELGFRQGGSFDNVVPKTGVEDAYLINDGQYATYRFGEETIRIGPGTRAHNWTQLRGALPKLDADCLYFTAYAPCEFEFTVE